MSQPLGNLFGLNVSTHVGPADGGADRKRWQFEINGEYVALRRDEVILLVNLLEQSGYKHGF